MGCGVVEYETATEAQHAVQVLNETELDGRTIKCREDRFVDEGDDNNYEVRLFSYFLLFSNNINIHHIIL